MKPDCIPLITLALLTVRVIANELEIVGAVSPFLCMSRRLTFLQNQKDSNRQQCQGMYSRKAWGGDTDPFVLTKFIKNTPKEDEDPVVSLVIFEWRDEDLVGVWPSEDAPQVRPQAHRLLQFNR